VSAYSGASSTNTSSPQYGHHDYILAMPGLQISDCRALNEVPEAEWVSDHCPIVAELVL